MLVDENLKLHLSKWMNQLSDRHCEVLKRRFGLGDYERQTLEVIGEAIGLTRERVRQIQIEALKILREVFEENGLSFDIVFDRHHLGASTKYLVSH